jgi:hypothetical protein
MPTKFTDFINQLEADARAEGPKAIEQLEASVIISAWLDGPARLFLRGHDVGERREPHLEAPLLKYGLCGVGRCDRQESGMDR